jgi:alpha,alpha-trehalose phosphorylase
MSPPVSTSTRSQKLNFSPRLPARLERLAFRLLVRGSRLKVEATKTHATYVLLDGAPLEVGHHGKTITVSTDGPVTEAIPPAAARPSPNQPQGRAPERRDKTRD